MEITQAHWLTERSITEIWSQAPRRLSVALEQTYVQLIKLGKAPHLFQKAMNNSLLLKQG
jgi:hypothetical protein